MLWQVKRAFLPSPFGRRAGDEGLRAGSIFLFVLHERRVAFKDKNIIRGLRSGKPSPQPSPSGRGS